MYAVEVREHFMIAHSLKGEVFGPAQGLHGATFIVDVAFFRQDLGAHGIVVDIGLALQALRAALQPLNYSNLDERPEFTGVVTTTEVLARHVFGLMADAARDGRLGPDAAGLDRIRVTLHESHVARAWYEGDLSG